MRNPEPCLHPDCHDGVLLVVSDLAGMFGEYDESIDTYEYPCPWCNPDGARVTSHPSGIAAMRGRTFPPTEEAR